jgi:hypothetical protein
MYKLLYLCAAVAGSTQVEEEKLRVSTIVVHALEVVQHAQLEQLAYAAEMVELDEQSWIANLVLLPR